MNAKKYPQMKESGKSPESNESQQSMINSVIGFFRNLTGNTLNQTEKEPEATIQSVHIKNMVRKGYTGGDMDLSFESAPNNEMQMKLTVGSGDKEDPKTYKTATYTAVVPVKDAEEIARTLRGFVGAYSKNTDALLKLISSMQNRSELMAMGGKGVDPMYVLNEAMEDASAAIEEEQLRQPNKTADEVKAELSQGDPYDVPVHTQPIKENDAYVFLNAPIFAQQGNRAIQIDVLKTRATRAFEQAQKNKPQSRDRMPVGIRIIQLDEDGEEEWVSGFSTQEAEEWMTTMRDASFEDLMKLTNALKNKTSHLRAKPFMQTAASTVQKNIEEEGTNNQTTKIRKTA